MDQESPPTNEREPGDMQLATFAGREGQAFTARLAAEHGVALTLDSVTPLRPSAPPAVEPHLRREPFSLVFVGPRELPLQQGTYVIEHAELGATPIFVVPVGPVGAGLGYEAIFT